MTLHCDKSCAILQGRGSSAGLKWQKLTKLNVIKPLE